jgi:hypothetical protein
MKWKGHVAYLGKKKNCIQGFVVKPGGNRPIGRCRKGGRIIKIDVKEICEAMYSRWHAVANIVTDTWVLLKKGEVFEWMNVNPLVVITYDHHVLGVKG